MPSRTAITGTVYNVAGNPATSGTVVFELQPSASSVAYRVQGTAIIAPASVSAVINASGQIKAEDGTSTLELWGNDTISPPNTYYRATFNPDGVESQIWDLLLIQGTSYDLESPTFYLVQNFVPNLSPPTFQQIQSDIVPAAPSQYSLGTADNPFASLYANQIFGTQITPSPDFPTTRNIAGDGATHVSAAFQALFDSYAGQILYITKPATSYYLDVDVTLPAAGITIITDPGVVFSGPGRMPGDPNNTAQKYVQTFFSNHLNHVGTVVEGEFTLSTSCNALAAFVGYAGAFYASAKSPAASPASWWGENILLELSAGLTGNGIASEIDLNNFASAGKGQGMRITGVGTASPQAGVFVAREDTTSDWQVGFWIQNSTIGLIIDGANVVAPQFGLEFRNYANNMMKFTPSTDANPTDAVWYITDHAGTTVNMKATKRGGLVFGAVIAASAEITKSLKGSATLNFGTVNANDSAILTISVTGALNGDFCVGGPASALASGFTYNIDCFADGVITVRVLNGTTGNADPDGGGGLVWNVGILRFA